MHSTKKLVSLSIIAIILIISSPIWTISFLNIVRPIPKQKFYWIESININGIKTWEMKNLRSDKSYHLTMFYMINKSLEKKEEIINFCKELIEKQKTVIQARVKEYGDKDNVRVDIYLETKSLPKYYKEIVARNKFAQRDWINDHFDDQIAMVFLNSNLEITYIWVIHAKSRDT
ncbi:MAG: hypothetical protein HDR37_06320 [Treponema sp.]|nr:hypothetical protein [Treponema sp.]